MWLVQLSFWAVFQISLVIIHFVIGPIREYFTWRNKLEIWIISWKQKKITRKHRIINLETLNSKTWKHRFELGKIVFGLETFLLISNHNFAFGNIFVDFESWFCFQHYTWISKWIIMFPTSRWCFRDQIAVDKVKVIFPNK